MKLDLTWKQFRFTLSISNVVTSATFLIPLSYAVDCSRFSGHVDHLNPIQSHFTGQMLLHCSAVFIWILFLWLCRSRWPPWPSSIALFTTLIRSSLRNSVNFYQWLTTNNNPQHHLYNINIVLLPATNNRLLLLLSYHDKLPLMVSVISKLTNFIDCVWKIEMGPTVSLKMNAVEIRQVAFTFQSVRLSRLDSEDAERNSSSRRIETAAMGPIDFWFGTNQTVFDQIHLLQPQ